MHNWGQFWPHNVLLKFKLIIFFLFQLYLSKVILPLLPLLLSSKKFVYITLATVANKILVSGNIHYCGFSVKFCQNRSAFPPLDFTYLFLSTKLPLSVYFEYCSDTLNKKLILLPWYPKVLSNRLLYVAWYFPLPRWMVWLLWQPQWEKCFQCLLLHLIQMLSFFSQHLTNTKCLWMT